MGGGDRSGGSGGVTSLSLCVFYSIWGEQPEVTQVPNWVSMAMAFFVHEKVAAGDDDMLPPLWITGIAELNIIPALEVLLASEIIPQSLDCIS